MDCIRIKTGWNSDVSKKSNMFSCVSLVQGTSMWLGTLEFWNPGTWQALQKTL